MTAYGGRKLPALHLAPVGHLGLWQNRALPALLAGGTVSSRELALSVSLRRLEPRTSGRGGLVLKPTSDLSWVILAPCWKMLLISDLRYLGWKHMKMLFPKTPDF